MKKAKKIMALLICMIMVLSMAPVVGSADGVGDIIYKAPLIQTVHMLKDAKDGSSDGNSTVYVNLISNYGTEGDKITYFANDNLFYNDKGPIMTFKIGETDNLKSATLKLNAARHTGDSSLYGIPTGDASTAAYLCKLTVRQYSFDDMPIAKEGTFSESETEGTYHKFYNAMNGAADSSVVIRGDEIVTYGNRANSDVYPVNFNLSSIPFEKNSDFSIVVVQSNREDYYSFQNADKAPYVEMVYDGDAILAEINNAENAADVDAFLNKWAEITGIDIAAYDALSDAAKAKVAEAVAETNFVSFEAVKTALNEAVASTELVVKYPLVQTVTIGKADNNIATLYFNTQNYGKTGDRCAQFQSMMKTFKVGSTKNVKSVTLRIKAANFSYNNTALFGSTASHGLTVTSYSTDDIKIDPTSAPQSGSHTATENITDADSYYNFKNSMTSVSIASNEKIIYGNRNESQTFPMSFDLNDVTFNENGYFTVVIKGGHSEDYYSVQNAENAPYLEFVYDKAAIFDEINSAEGADDVNEFLAVWGETIGINTLGFNALSEGRKAAVAEYLLKNKGEGFDSFDVIKDLVEAGMETVNSTSKVRYYVDERFGISDYGSDESAHYLTTLFERCYGKTYYDGEMKNYPAYLAFNKDNGTKKGQFFKFELGDIKDYISASLKLYAFGEGGVPGDKLKLEKYSTADLPERGEVTTSSYHYNTTNDNTYIANGDRSGYAKTYATKEENPYYMYYLNSTEANIAADGAVNKGDVLVEVDGAKYWDRAKAIENSQLVSFDVTNLELLSDKDFCANITAQYLITSFAWIGDKYPYVEIEKYDADILASLKAQTNETKNDYLRKNIGIFSDEAALKVKGLTDEDINKLSAAVYENLTSLDDAKAAFNGVWNNLYADFALEITGMTGLGNGHLGGIKIKAYETFLLPKKILAASYDEDGTLVRVKTLKVKGHFTNDEYEQFIGTNTVGSASADEFKFFMWDENGSMIPVMKPSVFENLITEDGEALDNITEYVRVDY